MRRRSLRFLFSKTDRLPRGREYLEHMTLPVGRIHTVAPETSPEGSILIVTLEFDDERDPSSRDLRRITTAAKNFGGEVDVESTVLNTPGRRLVRIVFADKVRALSAQALLCGTAFVDDTVGEGTLATKEDGSTVLTLPFTRKENAIAAGMNPRDLSKLVRVSALLGGTIDEILRYETPQD